MNEKILNEYYKNGAVKLKHTVDKLLLKFGGIDQKDYDDFYSLAGLVLAKIISNYDDSKSFETYFYSCLDRKIKTEITHRNRVKRQCDRNAISLDAPTENGGVTGDFIESPFDLDTEVFGEDEVENPKLKMYLNKLSKIQRNIIEMIAVGYIQEEIEGKLQITHKQYLDGLAAIHSYNNIAVLL